MLMLNLNSYNYWNMDSRNLFMARMRLKLYSFILFALYSMSQTSRVQTRLPTSKPGSYLQRNRKPHFSAKTASMLPHWASSGPLVSLSCSTPQRVHFFFFFQEGNIWRCVFSLLKKSVYFHAKLHSLIWKSTSSRRRARMSRGTRRLLPAATPHSCTPPELNNQLQLCSL